LIIDDSAYAGRVLSGLLTKFKIAAMTCESGAKGLREIEMAANLGQPFDLVIIDWNLAGQQGTDVARRIRTILNSSLPQPRIVIAIPYGQEFLFEKNTQTRASDFDGLIAKPISFLNLAACLQNTFSGTKPVPHLPIADETSLLLSHAKVLLAEDNPLNQEVAVAILNEGGLSVDIAENGQVAIEKIAHNHYDAVLMDMQMPVMDGLTATKLIREIPAYRKLPIIAMTANVMKADLDRCRQAGMNDHIGKPIDVSRLWQVLKKWIPIQSHPQSQEKTTVKETATLIPNLSRLPGLDFKGSVRRLGGRESSYLKILQIFVRNHLHAVEEIQQSLQQGNTNLALQQIHTLKGVAAQIGAQFVESEVTTLEGALQSRSSASMIESLSTSLALHFEMLIEQLHENLPSPPPDLDKL